MDNIVSNILEGTTHKAALAYLNTVRKIHDVISPKVRDIDWRLGRIADEYRNTDFEDGVAITRDVHELISTLCAIKRNIGTLDQAVTALAEKEAKTEGGK